MFYDTARIYVKGGDGGNGIVAFRREKYVPEGGPSGGDGGRGGNVILVADPGLRTLVDYRYKRHYKAERGEHGQGKNMHGQNAEDIRLRVPVGTVVRDSETGEILADLVEPGQEVIVARGGRGGRGNARFVSAQNRVPTLAENGEPGEERWIELELKLLADVGLVGFPNVGKSTLISRVSGAKPKIANYPFTTLAPNLGVVTLGEGKSFVVADIPGLIEGAHEGAGLGHAFLRHTERTRLLIHVLDIAGSEGRDPVRDFTIINQELALYSPTLAERPQVVAANKMDLPEAAANLERLKAAISADYEIFPISAVTGEGVQALMYRVGKILDELSTNSPPAPAVEQVRRVQVKNEPGWQITVEDGVFVVSGKDVERLSAMTNLDNEEAVRRFQRLMKKMGIDDGLRARGIKEGNLVRIRGNEFEWVD
ncbi:MAG: GTPase ObgE [Firmicutes bacterium]|nr:GTPase ObgE [Bacillota bacterium]